MKLILCIILLFVCPIFAQTEILTNSEIIEMTKAGLSQKVILEKIQSSVCEFDSSAKALIELKKAGVEDEVISELIEKAKLKRERYSQSEEKPREFINYSESSTTEKPQKASDLLRNAKTIAIKKSTLHPARQNLEKALLKRDEWKKFNLTLTQYQETADLFLEIGRVPMTLLTHRYVFRIMDTKSGIVIAAGETTSWGSLAENLAGNIVKELKKVKE